MLAVLLGTGAILSLAIDVTRQVEELASANTQSAQWAMAQADVEFLAFLLATHPPATGGEVDLEALRRRHDIFFGRVRMLEAGSALSPLNLAEDYQAAIKELDRYISEVTPLFDGADAALISALPQIRLRAEEIRPQLRFVTLTSQRELAKESDSRRGLATKTLKRIGALTFLLITALISLVVGLGVLLRRVRSNASREALTHARLRAIIRASIDGILVVDEAGVITEANAAAEFQLGPRPNGLVGLHVDELITSTGPDGQPRRGLPPPGPRYTRIETLRQNGTRNPAECSVAETMGEGERIRICFLHDISHRLAAEQALTQARDRALAGEKSKTDMLAVMSHEMRTPLNGILGTLDLVEETRLTALQREYMRIIRTSGDQLLGHVNDVLDISRLDAGKMTVARQPFPIATLLTDLAESQRPMAEAQGNQVVVNLQLVGDWVEGDPQKLSQVLLNLLGNAVKFTRGGTIVLDALRHEGKNEILFRVSDTGIGIAEKDLERIFDEFVTLDASYGRTAEGTGLGLPISRRLVQAMGGELQADSRPGHGSSFHFTLPLPAAAAPEASPPASAGAEGEAPLGDPWRPLNVLIVEDSPINRFVLRAMLEGDGHDVTEAVDGAEGLRLAGERGYDLIFMDIAMPGLDGTEATRRIRASGGPCTGVPIIALTAHALPADLARFAEAGLTATLTKPLTRPQLRDMVRRLSGRLNGPAAAEAKGARAAEAGGAASKRRADGPAPGQPASRDAAEVQPERTKASPPPGPAAREFDLALDAAPPDQALGMAAAPSPAGPVSLAEKPAPLATASPPRHDAAHSDIAPPEPAAKASPQIVTLLDLEQTRTLRSGLGDEVFGRLLERYIAETTTELSILHHGYGHAPAQSLADKTHTLAGSAAIFGAQAMRLQLIALEQALRELDDEVADEILSEIDALWEDTRQKLSEAMR